MGIEHASTGTKVALVSTFLRVLRDMAPSPATTALRIRVKENKFLKDLGRRNFNTNNKQWARTSLPVYSNDDWTTKYVKIMEQHDLLTTNSTLDTTLVVDGVSYMSRKTWLAAGISLDTPWADLFLDGAPKSCKQLWKEGFKLTLNEYMNTIAMVTTGALAEYLNKVLTVTEAPISFDPRNRQLEQFRIEGSIFKNTIVFTDGSAKDQEAGWGVFFKKGSKFNAYGKVVGFPNNFIAELEAIGYALCIAPTTPFLTVFTDSEAAIKAIKAARASSLRKLAHMPAKDTLARILNVINEREAMGSDVSFLHVYSHQQQKLTSNPTKWEPLITKSNFGLSRDFPKLDYVRGNEEADALAEKGRTLGHRPDIIPVGLEDFVVLPVNGKVPLEDPHIKKAIRSKDCREWDLKAQALIHKDQKRWWTNKVSHQILEVPELGSWLRRARLHNRTTTTLLSQNTSKATTPKLAKVYQATSSSMCPMSGCACKDTQDHILYCRHSRQTLSKLTHKVNTITEQCSTGLTIEAYWIPGVDRRPPSDTGKPRPKLKWGTLGLVPKDTWNHLVSVLGESKAREIALKINLEVVNTLFQLDAKRMSRIRKIIHPEPGIPNDAWKPR
jgi:ribonuclease HI